MGSRWAVRSSRGWCESWFNRVLAQQRKHTLPTVSLDGLDLSNQSVDPTEEVESLDRRMAVRRALSGLNQEHRQVVILRYFAGLTVPEVAQATGQREGTIKSRNPPGVEPLAGPTKRGHRRGG